VPVPARDGPPHRRPRQVPLVRPEGRLSPRGTAGPRPHACSTDDWCESGHGTAIGPRLPTLPLASRLSNTPSTTTQPRTSTPILPPAPTLTLALNSIHTLTVEVSLLKCLWEGSPPPPKPIPRLPERPAPRPRRAGRRLRTRPPSTPRWPPSPSGPRPPGGGSPGWWCHAGARHRPRGGDGRRAPRTVFLFRVSAFPCLAVLQRLTTPALVVGLVAISRMRNLCLFCCWQIHSSPTPPPPPYTPSARPLPPGWRTGGAWC